MGPEAVGKWLPSDLMGFAQFFDAKYGVERALPFPGTEEIDG